MGATLARALATVAVVGVLAGCGAPRAAPQANADHAHTGPNGGTILGCCGDGPQVEFVADRARQRVTIHFLDEEGRPARVRASDLTLRLTSADGPVALEPSPAEGEGGGQFSSFSADLPESTRGRNLAGRLVGNVDGRPLDLELAGHRHAHD
ncbi:MAG: hypothetical protein U0797_07990 [Gemmataceae bacterium]